MANPTKEVSAPGRRRLALIIALVAVRISRADLEGVNPMAAPEG